MKLNHLLGAVMITLASSVAFVSCDKDNAKKEEPIVVEQKTDYAKLLVGDYDAIIKASAHGAITETKGLVKVKSTSKNVLSIDVPSFQGYKNLSISPFTLPNVKVSKTGATYTLNSAEQTISITMGKPYPNSKVSSTGSVNQEGVLSMNLTWFPNAKYEIHVTIKDAKKVVQ